MVEYGSCSMHSLDSNALSLRPPCPEHVYKENNQNSVLHPQVQHGFCEAHAGLTLNKVNVYICTFPLQAVCYAMQ